MLGILIFILTKNGTHSKGTFLNTSFARQKGRNLKVDFLHYFYTPCGYYIFSLKYELMTGRYLF